MSFNKLVFTKDWKNPANFPTIETSEIQVRADLQDLHDQTRDAFNSLIDGLEGTSGASNQGITPIEGLSATTVQEALEETKGLVDEKVNADDAADTYETLEDAALHFVNVDYDNSTGVITFTRKDGTTKTIDTDFEKMAVNFDFDEATQRLVLTLEDGTVKYIDLSVFVKPNEFVDSSSVTFSVSGQTVTAHINPDYLGQAETQAGIATTQAGIAKGYAESAGETKDNIDAIVTEQIIPAVDSASGSASAALGSASAAASSASDASGYSINSRSWAVGGTGTRAGEDTNNAKYWSEQAREAASTEGDMLKSTYDTNNNGVVDDAEKLGGQLPSYYATKEDLDTKMERYVMRLVKNADNTYKLTSLDDTDLSFTEVYDITRDLKEYVVIIYGSSKLRPQYVSTNEMSFIGLDRSNDSKILRILYTPTRLDYQTFKLAESSEVQTALNGKANKPTEVTSTMSASNWSGNDYSFEGTYPTASYSIEVAIAPTATEAQRDAYANAMMTGYITNKVKALGEVPTVDIPIVIKVVAL